MSKLTRVDSIVKSGGKNRAAKYCDHCGDFVRRDAADRHPCNNRKDGVIHMKLSPETDDRKFGDKQKCRLMKLPEDFFKNIGYGKKPEPQTFEERIHANMHLQTRHAIATAKNLLDKSRN